MFVFVRALGFFKFDFSNGDQGCYIQELFGPRFWVCRDCFGSLSDIRSYERCEGAGKTALKWECELLYKVRNGDQGCKPDVHVYKALFGPRFWVCRDCFDSLSDGRSYEKCEGAGKTALRWKCELSYNQNRVRVVGSQLLRAAGYTETGFSNLIYIAFITAWL